jgi:Spy/CpxP family protein refolding chaperone
MNTYNTLTVASIALSTLLVPLRAVTEPEGAAVEMPRYKRSQMQSQPDSSGIGTRQLGIQRGGPGGDGHGAGLLKQLNLSPEQRTQLRERKEERLKMRELVFKAKGEREKLKAMLMDPEASDAQIIAQAALLKNLLTESIDAKIANALSLKKILTPEQFEGLMKKVGSKGVGGNRGWRKGQGVQNEDATESLSVDDEEITGN